MGIPTVTIAVADTTLAIGGTSLVTFTFSEAVDPSSVHSAARTSPNGTLGPLTTSDNITYTATFTPTAAVTDATNVITLDMSQVEDLDLLFFGSGVASSNNYAVDTVRPTATIVLADTALRVGETSLVTVTFSEAVTGFTLGDLTVANGTVSGLSTSDGGVTWTATLTPAAAVSDTTNLISLENIGVTDLAGNTGSGTTDSNNYAIDTVRPTASIAVADAALAIGETSLVTFTFSQAVTGFTNADLTVANGTLSAVSSSDGGITWTATLTPSAATTVTTNVITVDNTGYQSAGGNTGSGTTDSNNYVIDTQRPTASIVVADTALAAGETSLVTFTFSEAVTGFTLADVTVENATLSGLSSSDGGLTWTATLTPAAAISDATNLILLNNGGVADLAGNTGSGVTNSNNYAIDTVRPTATIVVADTQLTAGETSLVTFTFSEAVTGFTLADLTVENGTLSGLSTSDGGLTWTATLTPTTAISDATNLILLNNGGVADVAGNTGSGVTNSNNYAIDTTAAPPPPPEPPEPPPTPINLPGSTAPDVIVGNDLDNTVAAGDGNDTASGGRGNDSITGDAGDDLLQGNSGNDDLSGGTGADTVLGGRDNDHVHGNSGADYASGDKGADTVHGGQGDDIVYGGEGDDYVSGDRDNDIVRGGQGDDHVFGGDGDDYISGDRGADTVSGGLGADVFHTFGEAGLDLVVDFNRAEGDRVMLDVATVYTVSQVGADTVIDMEGGGQMVLANVQLSTLTAGWIFVG